MNREQVSIVHSVGKTVEAVIFSKWRQMVLIAFRGNEFAIVKAQSRYDGEDGEIAWDVPDVGFDHYDYSEEDLEKVFGSESVIQWKADKAKRELEVKQKMEDRRREEYERLKAEFEGPGATSSVVVSASVQTVQAFPNSRTLELIRPRDA